MNRYIYNHGAGLYKVFATHPEPGLAALDAIAAEMASTLTAAIFLDWLAALNHNDTNAQGYQLRDGLECSLSIGINNCPQPQTAPGQPPTTTGFWRYCPTLTFTGNHTLLKMLPLSQQPDVFSSQPGPITATCSSPAGLT
ncbi:MAG: hypothetical protein H6656_12985 [Ardenticatenaceae bacterium]|nr:hypothetical protein [Ardenticatenaceae bacterium]